MKVIDLFCGAGGFSHGFHQAGFEIVLGVDNDPTVKDTFLANHPDAEFIHSDVIDLDQDLLESYETPHVLLGSPPCINFTLINTDREPDKGLELVKEFLRIKDIIQPRGWIMENVAVAEKPIRSLIPNVRAEILDAADFGVPQFRKRMFLGNHASAIPTHTKHPGQTTMYGTTQSDWVRLRDVLDPMVNYGFIGKEREAKLIRLKETRTSGNDVRIGTVPYPDILDKPSRTLLAKISKVNRNTIVVEVNGRRRLLSLKERSRIQGFPDSFLWFGTPSMIERHIGNAVCPPVARALAESLLKRWTIYDTFKK